MINLISLVRGPARESAEEAGPSDGDVETGAELRQPVPAAPPAMPTVEGDTPSPHSDDGDSPYAQLQARLRAAAVEVGKGVNTMGESMRAMRQAHSADMQATRPEVMQAQQDALLKEVQSTAALAHRLKRLVDDLDADKPPFEAGGSGAMRQHTTVVLALRKKLASALSEFSALRTQLEKDHQSLLARRYAAVTGHPPSDDELERLAGDGASRDAAEAVFRQAITATRANEVLARAALAEVHERHAVIVDIERSMAQLQQMFLDLAALVEAQGETVDCIEQHVLRSVAYVDRARHHMKQARRLQRGVRMRVVLSIIAAAALVALIVVAIAVPVSIAHG